MTVIEDIRRMQLQGVGDEQIIQNLREKGVDYREIADSLAQSKIKAAVEQADNDPSSYGGGTNREEMQPSIMNQNPPQEVEIQAPTPGASYPGQNAPQYGPQQIQELSPYTEGYGQQTYGTSPDLTTEIAEQVVAEKLGEIRKHLEKIADMRTTFESRVEFLDERLKRIEKVIDTLQSTVLRKVGDYVTNVDDIKKELIETQKTFAKLVPEIHRERHSTAHEHHPHHTKK